MTYDFNLNVYYFIYLINWIEILMILVVVIYFGLTRFGLGLCRFSDILLWKNYADKQTHII